ncbi:trp operon leader peptide [Streptomyces naganishii]
MVYSSVGRGRAPPSAEAGPARGDGRPPSTRRGRRKPSCGAYGRSGRGPVRGGGWGRVRGMFAHSTQNQNWWWTAFPAAR